MGSSLVKPSRRESQRRGVNAASASKGDARVSNGNFDQQKDEGYKVDTLAGPVSNYCKPITVISQSDKIRNGSLSAQVNKNMMMKKSFSSRLASTNPDVQIAESSKYISPVLEKDFGSQNTLETRSKPKLVNNKPLGTGSGDSSVVGLHSVSKDQQRAPRKRFFTGSCIGKPNKTQEVPTDSPSPQGEKCEVKFKESDNEVHIVEPDHDDQDVSRDARTPSPEFNDFENVIVTEPIASKPCASTSSPIDKYAHSKDLEAAEEDSLTTVSITKSDNPAPVHQGELRCELNKKLKVSPINLAQNQNQGQGDILNDDLRNQSKKEEDCDMDNDKVYDPGDSMSEKIGEFRKNDQGPISRNSGTEKLVTEDCDDENTLHISESFGVNVDAHSESGIPQTNSAVRQGADEQRLPVSVHSYKNNPGQDYAGYLGSKSPAGGCLTESKNEKEIEPTNVYICANVKLETRPFSEISGLQGCTTGATKCFCDINQFDYDNGADGYKCKTMHFPIYNSDSTKIVNEEHENVKDIEVLTEIATKENLNLTTKMDEKVTLGGSEQQRVDDAGINARGTNKSEPDMTTQTRMGRLNCWRPESGGCTIGRLDKDKRQRCEHRPASWSHINSKRQRDEKHLTIRPHSAATGDAMWGNESAIDTAMTFASTSSSALDVSPSPSNTSLPRLPRSQASIINDKSCHSDVSEASNKSSCRSLQESKTQPVTPNTSFHRDNESLKTQNTHDLERPLSSQRSLNGKLENSRAASAQSSHTSAIDPTDKLSHQSLPRLAARSSRHNLSRSLSHHSHEYNAMHSSRPSSFDSLKHSPRPPSGLREEGGIRKVLSRPPSVQLSGSVTTAVKQFSNHSLSKEPTQKTNFELYERSHHHQTYTSSKGDDVLSSQNPLSTSQVKLPPIKTTTNLCQNKQLADSWTSLGQPVRLPPVTSVESGVRVLGTDEKALPTVDLDTLSSWPKPGNLRGLSLPPVPVRGEVNLERTSVVGNVDKNDLLTSGNSKLDGCSFLWDGHSYKKGSNEHLKTEESPHDMGHLCSSSVLTNAPLQEKSERGDPKPSPNSSQIGVEETSLSTPPAQKSTSDDLKRLLAAYLLNKSTTPSDKTTTPSDFPVTSANDCTEGTNGNPINKETRLENDETEAKEKFVNFPEYTKNSSDFSNKDYLSISSKQKDNSIESSCEINEQSNYSSCGLLENLDESTNSEKLKDGDDKDDVEDVSKVETSTLTPSSPSATDYNSILAKYSTSVKEGQYKFGNSSAYSTVKSDVVENCMNVSESAATKGESNENEGLDCNKLLEKYSIRNDNIKSNIQFSKDLSAEKSETADKPCSLNPIDRQDATLPSQSEYISSLIPKTSLACSNTSEQICNTPGFSTEAEGHAEPPSKSFGEYKTNTTSAAFDIAAIMAKYSTAKSESKPNLEKTPDGNNMSEEIDSEEKKSPVNDILILDGKNSASAYEDSGVRERDLQADCKADLVSKMDNLSVEEKSYFVETDLANTKNVVDIEENNEVKTQEIDDDKNNTLACPINDHSGLSKYVSGPCSPDTLKSNMSEEKMVLPTPSCLEENSEKKLDTQLGLRAVNEDTDYLNQFSERMSSFGERFANLPSLTLHYPGNRGNEEPRVVVNSKIPTITNVLPIDAPDDETVDDKSSGIHEELREPLTDDVCMCRPTKIERDMFDGPRVKIAESPTDCEIESTIANKWYTPKPEDGYLGLPEITITEFEKNISFSKAEINPIEKGQTVSGDEMPGSGDMDTVSQDKPITCREGGQNTSKEVYALSPQVKLPCTENGNSDDAKRSPNDFGCTLQTSMDETEYQCKNDIFSVEIQHGNTDLNCAPDILQNDTNNEDTVIETSSKLATMKVSPSESHSNTKELLETNVPEILPSERIDTIKQQIYEEGLKPCKRDGGVAFFIPVSNTGLQPPVNNPDIGERLAKPKKPSMNYEERMMMADINRQEQLTKRKEFAVKDLINVKSATTSSASASGENISGGGQHDHPDRSDAGSLH